MNQISQSTFGSRPSPTPTPELIRRYPIVGARRFSNIFWALTISTGGVYFVLTGLSSYFGYPILPFIAKDLNNILFFPQGIVMCFYGSLGLLFSIYLWLSIFWKVGAGFNEFNKKKGSFRIFRWGFPGKNRKIDFSYPLNDIEAIRVEIINGFNPKRRIYLRLKGKKQIPITRIGGPIPLGDIEKQASDLAMFLQVPLDEI